MASIRPWSWGRCFWPGCPPKVLGVVPTNKSHGKFCSHVKTQVLWYQRKNHLTIVIFHFKFVRTSSIAFWLGILGRLLLPVGFRVPRPQRLQWSWSFHQNRQPLSDAACPSATDRQLGWSKTWSKFGTHQQQQFPTTACWKHKEKQRMAQQKIQQLAHWKRQHPKLSDSIKIVSTRKTTRYFYKVSNCFHVQCELTLRATFQPLGFPMFFPPHNLFPLQTFSGFFHGSPWKATRPSWHMDHQTFSFKGLESWLCMGRLDSLHCMWCYHVISAGN